jgi:hypothetical protein|tara:strand:- start:222 stop:776 length:555 start_codon:yes stop_codon:yes gene_type:complete
MSVKLDENLSQKIFLEYCEGVVQEDGKKVTVGLDHLANKYNVSRATLFRKSKKEDWSKKRIDFISKTREKITENRTKEIADEARKLDQASLRIASGFLSKVANKLVQDQAAEQSGMPVLSPEQLRSLSAVAMNAQRIGKLALGEASEITKVNADVTVPDSFREVMSELHAVREARAEKFSNTIQ